MPLERSNGASPSLTELANRFGSDKGTDPGEWGLAHGYAVIYERFLAARRLEPLRLLEIGVWKGGSLRMWESYLPNAQIIGIDNLPNIVQENAQRTEILIGDAADQQFLIDAAHRFSGGKIDIVIDDASHILDQQVPTFETLFPFVEERGLYFVEDISGSRFKDGNRRVLPFLDFLDYSWNLAQQTTFFPDDQISNYHHIRDIRILSGAERDQLRVSYWNSNLGSVHYFHNLCVFEKLHRQLKVDHLKQTNSLRLRPGISYELSRQGLRSDRLQMDDPEVDHLRLEFERFVDLISDQMDALESENGISQKNETVSEIKAEGGKAKMLLDRARAMAGQFNRFVIELKTRKYSFERLEKLANASESARMRISQELKVVQSTNEALSAEVGRLQDQLEDARSKLQDVWDFIFRLKAEHVAELTQLKTEFPKLSPALVDLKRQANALRLQNADWKEAVDRMSLALAKSKVEASERARERDEVRFQIARRLTSKVWLLKGLFRL